MPTQPLTGLTLRVEAAPTQTGLRVGALPAGNSGLAALLLLLLLCVETTATQAVTTAGFAVGTAGAATGWTRRTFHDGRCPPVSVRPEAFVRLTDRTSVRRRPCSSQIRR
ncbi:hypothetical protein JCM9957A_30740 [Kineosporia succinea]